MERGEGLERRGGGSFNGSLFVLGKQAISHTQIALDWDCHSLTVSRLYLGRAETYSVVNLIYIVCVCPVN